MSNIFIIAVQSTLLIPANTITANCLRHVNNIYEYIYRIYIYNKCQITSNFIFNQTQGTVVTKIPYLMPESLIT